MGSLKSQTRLSNFTFTFHFHALEKEMATHSSVLAWRIPGTGGAWWAAVYGVAQSQTQLKRLSSSSSMTFLGRRQWHPTPILLPGKSMDGGAWRATVHGVARSRTGLRDFIFTFMHWRRKWRPTPVFLPGESQGWGSLVGCCLWGRTESDMTEVT